jgi:hypothetical protein
MTHDIRNMTFLDTPMRRKKNKYPNISQVVSNLFFIDILCYIFLEIPTLSHVHNSQRLIYDVLLWRINLLDVEQ